MDHGYFKERISSFFDAQLPPDEYQIVEEHLQSCEECKALLSELEKIDLFVEQNSMPGESDYWDTAAKRIDKAVAAIDDQKITKVVPGWKGLGWKITAVAASVAFLTFIGLHETDISDQSEPYIRSIPELIPPAENVGLLNDSMYIVDRVDETIDNESKVLSEAEDRGSDVSLGLATKEKAQPEVIAKVKVKPDKKKADKPIVGAQTPRGDNSRAGKAAQLRERAKEEVVIQQKTDVLAEAENKVRMQSLSSEVATMSVDKLIMPDATPDSLLYWESQLRLLERSGFVGKQKTAMADDQAEFDSVLEKDSGTTITVAQCYYNIAKLTRQTNSVRYDQVLESLKKLASDSSKEVAREANEYLKVLTKSKQ